MGTKIINKMYAKALMLLRVSYNILKMSNRSMIKYKISKSSIQFIICTDLFFSLKLVCQYKLQLCTLACKFVSSNNRIKDGSSLVNCCLPIWEGRTKNCSRSPTTVGYMKGKSTGQVQEGQQGNAPLRDSLLPEDLPTTKKEYLKFDRKRVESRLGNPIFSVSLKKALKQLFYFTYSQ